MLVLHHVHITGPDSHPAITVPTAAGTTILLGIDDIHSAKKAEALLSNSSLDSHITHA